MWFKTSKYLLFFILFFLLFYAETIEIGGIIFSQIWKIPLLIWMIVYIIKNKTKKSPIFVRIYYFISFKNLINSGFFSSLIVAIQEGIKYLFIPLLYDTFNNSEKGINKLYSYLLILAQYFILTNIPFLLGFLENRGKALEYGDFLSYSGIFQNQHAMSTIMCLSILVLLFFFKNNFFSTLMIKLYNILLLIIAFYALYLSFARTGWLMCVFGIIVLFYPRKITIKQVLIFLFFSFILYYGFEFMMYNNNDFRYRILGINAVTEKQQDIGSGRFDYIKYAIEYWNNGNWFEFFMGRSMDGLKSFLHSKTGMYIPSHNGFVNVLVVNGILGLCLFLIYIYTLFKYIRRRKSSTIYRLALSMWFTFFLYQLTQGGNIFHMDIFYSLVYVILAKEYSYVNRRIKIKKI